ncbi:SpoIIE family protein phosphatase [Streptomyces lavendulae]|uniref:SpoIIE family protein phosphatase n=1 Tax=Streptomyces lavendulae TaxID=1914 RepID=UPI0036C2FF3A
MPEHGTVVVGTARRPGTEPPCTDGLDVRRRGNKVCAAVVDGADHHEDVVRYSSIAPAVITHTGMATGGLAGLITAGRIAQAYEAAAHASAVYACMEPDWPTAVHWIGDCHAYGWDGTALTRWTTDRATGQRLRRDGGIPTVIAEARESRERLGLAQAGVATCHQVEIPEEVRLVLLVSDGVSDQVGQDMAEALCRCHGANPQALADALVTAAVADGDGYRDDATVIALLRPPPWQPPRPDAERTRLARAESSESDRTH